MSKKPTAKSTGQGKPSEVEVVRAPETDQEIVPPTISEPAPDNTEKIEHAIIEGKKLIDAGKTKIDAAMVIYVALENEPHCS